MNKNSQWAKALNESTEKLKTTISNNEAQSTKEIAEVLRSASQQRLNTIKRVIAEERQEYDQSVRELFKVKTWQWCVMFFPLVICAFFLMWSVYLNHKIDTQKAQSEYWAQHMGNAQTSSCTDVANGQTEGRACVKVVTGQTYGENRDYMVIQGY
ncbi:hypothetical protein YN16_23135 [Salmonella enterica subsp. enterica serovar Virchow]|nr:hypothetical protein [Salmonella enterica subsp. enterica serovar Virchow]